MNQETLVGWADRLVYRSARHWLLLVNTAIGLFLLLPFLAPTLMATGMDRPARLLYLIYRPTCHQLPERSYFLFGERALYDIDDLEARGLEPDLGMFQRNAFIGNEQTGFKVAICQRDIAIYGSIFLAGLAFAGARQRLRSPGWKVFVVLVIPIALDGFTQLLGLRLSNWWLRTVTGSLFGAGAIWLLYPLIEESMQEVANEQASKIGQRK